MNSGDSHGVDVLGGTKPLSMSTRCTFQRLGVWKLAPLQQASGSLHDEAWACPVGCLSLTISKEVEIQHGCAVYLTFHPLTLLPRHLDLVGKLGVGSAGHHWEKTERSGVWFFRGALQEERIFPALAAAGDWAKRGLHHTARSVPLLSSCLCSYSCGRRTVVRPQTGERCWPLLSGLWRAIPDEAMVC